jgi:hypothetical protein
MTWIARAVLIAATTVGVSADALAQNAPAEPQPAPQPGTEGLSEEDLALMAEAEAIEIFAERPDKPFDRDTEVRLTGEQLAARGATDLGTALALLPDVTVREAGRGGFNVDIRGARKGAVAILVDGVSVTDPYYGTFDVSTIPVTDIVQIRVSTTPKSPIDGPGGPGGIIEVHTRDAIGSQLVVARLIGDSLPSFGVSGTARVALAKHLALRISAAGLMGARDMELPPDLQGNPQSLGESRRAAGGATRLEYRKGARRIALDGFVDDRHYLSPPSDTVLGSVLMIDRETTTRASGTFDDKLDKLQVQAQTWAHTLFRRSRTFQDHFLTREIQAEELSAKRFGAKALATRPFLKDFRWATSLTIDHERADVTRTGGPPSEAEVTLIEAAIDGQYEHKRVRIDAAAGVAIPFGIDDADPWPEGKLVGKIKPVQHFELTATGAYKGRVPSLRERFDSQTGNPALGPENTLHGEVRAIETLDRVRVEVAPFVKRTTGSVRLDMATGKVANFDTMVLYGIDTQAKVNVHAMVEVGASYGYVKACQLGSQEGCDVGVAMMGGADPLDRLPRHRADGWLQVMPAKNVSALVRARYIGDAIDLGVACTTDMNGRELGPCAHVLLDATATATIGKEYLAVLKVDDLLNRRPETRLGYHSPGRVVMVVFQGSWD